MTELTTLLIAPQIMAAARISDRQLDYWVRQGILKPDMPHPGSGQRRRFEPIEALVARVCACVQCLTGPTHGLDTDLLRRLAEAVRTDTRETGWGEVDIFVDTDAVTLVIPITDLGPADIEQ